jgi:DNA-binding transcriptional MerR regulator
MGLMGIGEFARLSRLSPKALRLYDELGLLPPARIDLDSGYRWYASGQLDQARLVASLRQIGVPLAQIKVILGLDAQGAAEQIGAYWAGAEAEHAARRMLASYLVDRLNGKSPVMYEVAVRDIPARTMLSLLRHVHADEQIPVGREFLIGRMRGESVPSPEGIAGAPFVIYHGEVTEDSDGPVEWCWPVPDDQAASIAVRFLTSPCAPSPRTRRRSSTWGRSARPAPSGRSSGRPCSAGSLSSTGRRMAAPG